MKTAVGGTFNVLHRGHRILLDKAFEVGDEVAIGVMSDAFVAQHKTKAMPLEQRLAAVESYASAKGKPFTVGVIDAPEGTLMSDPSIGSLVVGPEAFSDAERFSKERAAAGLSPLRLYRVPFALADDCTPISSTRVIQGEIDENGRLLRTMKVSVGSDNPVKVHAVENVMRRIFTDVQVLSCRVSASVPQEPWDDDVEKGAIERAKRSLGRNDFGIGIEAGIFEHNDLLYDVQFCAVVDKMGRVTLGHGPGFLYPPSVAEKLRIGGTVGEAFHELYGQERTGRGQGAIGFLTHGLLTRSELTEQAVVAAMVPRIRKDLYFEE
ncbi:MAG: inosine/xanthosine triphosphatase [Methanomassiliicoccales archaeon]|nr:inosine/xanthosine triphosphatase [Methanomassiliicoccales archaeon]